MNKYKLGLIKRILLLNLGSFIVFGATYIILIFFLSHINSFWEIFRGKESYSEKDTVPPTSPYIEPIPKAIKENSVTIIGKTEPGATVILYVDTAKYSEIVSDNEGNFTFSSIPVSISITTIKAEAIDQNQNKSTPSKEYTIYQDTEAPKIEILTPKKGELYKATERTYSVSGITEPEAIVTINEIMAYADSEGTFSAQLALRDGGNEIKLKATDVAGNETEEKIYMTFEKIE